MILIFMEYLWCVKHFSKYFTHSILTITLREGFIIKAILQVKGVSHKSFVVQGLIARNWWYQKPVPAQDRPVLGRICPLLQTLALMLSTLAFDSHLFNFSDSVSLAPWLVRFSIWSNATSPWFGYFIVSPTSQGSKESPWVWPSVPFHESEGAYT